MEKHEVVILNELIEKIYTDDDYTKMRKEFLEILDSLIPYNSSSFYLASVEGDKLLTDPVGVGIPESELQRYIDDYEEKDYTLWIYNSGKSFVYRETDLFPDKKREMETYYKEIYVPSKIYYSMQLCIAYQGEFLAVVSFYREKEKGNFTDDEIFVLDQLKSHLEYRCQQEREKEKQCDPDIKNLTHFDAYHFVEKYNLTTREVEVLGLLFAGMSNERICNTLSVSPHTYKKHCMNIYKKLEINHRWELINYL